MPFPDFRRSFPMREWAALLIFCLGSAAAGAEGPFVPPDEAAGLASVAKIETGDDRREEPDDGQPQAPSPLSLRSGLKGEGRPSTFESALQVTSREAELFSDPIGLEPVVRGQSPEVSLIPLATGDSSIESTSLLSWATGTQGRIRGDYLTDFDETDRIGMQILTRTWLGLGIDAEANYWQRPVAGLGREPLWTGDLNLTYNMIPHPRFKFRSGVGGAWTLDDGDAHAGYNVTHGLDLYLLWRFMFTAEADWGKIDDDDLLRYRLALGLTWKSVEFYSGYESYKLGNERLDGWVNGLAVWY